MDGCLDIFYYNVLLVSVAFIVNSSKYIFDTQTFHVFLEQ